ncbi:MAG: DnaD domain protein [Lachnospiraceae bacterium]|nr:DnaD domain protein [Lachnospiraceae bacterium]
MKSKKSTNEFRNQEGAVMKIYTDTPEGSTVVQNTFIDQYMPQANGEFVKVYLYLLRCADSGRELSLSSVADVFEHTEKDVRRALTYWERQNLIRTKLTDEGEIVSVTFTDPGCYSTPVILAEEILCSDGMAEHRELPRTARIPGMSETFRTSEIPETSGTPETPAMAHEDAGISAPMLSSLSASAQQELKELFPVAEQYLRRPLSASEQNDFVYYYHTLGFSTDLIEYLLDYCLTHGTTSRQYMRKVALGWAEAGITTVQEAKRESGLYNKNYYQIMKAFGIRNRHPAASEQQWMQKWLDEYALPIDLILEACRRTIDKIHEPSFTYADSILSQWHEDGIYTMEDVRAADQKWEQEQAGKRNAQKAGNAQKPAQAPAQAGRTQGKANRFNSFTQRNYDYDSLEKKVFGQK